MYRTTTPYGYQNYPRRGYQYPRYYGYRNKGYAPPFSSYRRRFSGYGSLSKKNNGSRLRGRPRYRTAPRMGGLRSKASFSRSRNQGPVNPCLNVGLPTFVYRYSTVSTSAAAEGRQGITPDGAFLTLDIVDCGAMLALAGYSKTTASSEQYVTVYDRYNEFRCTNNHGTPVEMNMYTVVPRRDHALGYGPVATWVSGMKRQHNASAVDYSIFSNFKFTDSKQFCSAYKVMKTRIKHLYPGETWVIKLRNKKHKRFNYNRSNDEFTTAASFAYYHHLTTVYAFVTKPAALSVSGNPTSVGGGANNSMIVHDSIIKFYGHPAGPADAFSNTDNQNTSTKSLTQFHNPQTQNLGTSVFTEYAI